MTVTYPPSDVATLVTDHGVGWGDDDAAVFEALVAARQAAGEKHYYAFPPDPPEPYSWQTPCLLAVDRIRIDGPGLSAPLIPLSTGINEVGLTIQSANFTHDQRPLTTDALVGDRVINGTGIGIPSGGGSLLPGDVIRFVTAGITDSSLWDPRRDRIKRGEARRIVSVTDDQIVLDKPLRDNYLVADGGQFWISPTTQAEIHGLGFEGIGATGKQYAIRLNRAQNSYCTNIRGLGIAQCTLDFWECLDCKADTVVALDGDDPAGHGGILAYATRCVGATENCEFRNVTARRLRHGFTVGSTQGNGGIVRNCGVRGGYASRMTGDSWDTHTCGEDIYMYDLTAEDGLYNGFNIECPSWRGGNLKAVRMRRSSFVFINWSPQPTNTYARALQSVSPGRYGLQATLPAGSTGTRIDALNTTRFDVEITDDGSGLFPVYLGGSSALDRRKNMKVKLESKNLQGGYGAYLFRMDKPLIEFDATDAAGNATGVYCNDSPGAVVRVPRGIDFAERGADLNTTLTADLVSTAAAPATATLASVTGLASKGAFDAGTQRISYKGIVGNVLQNVRWYADTELVTELEPTDTTAAVEDTQYWPASGSYYCPDTGEIGTYTGITTTSITGITRPGGVGELAIGTLLRPVVTLASGTAATFKGALGVRFNNSPGGQAIGGGKVTTGYLGVQATSNSTDVRTDLDCSDCTTPFSLAGGSAVVPRGWVEDVLSNRPAAAKSNRGLIWSDPATFGGTQWRSTGTAWVVEARRSLGAALRTADIQTLEDVPGANLNIAAATIYSALAVCHVAGIYSRIGCLHGAVTPASLADMRMGVADPATGARRTDTGDISASFTVSTIGLFVIGTLATPQTIAEGEAVKLTIGALSGTLPQPKGTLTALDYMGAVNALGYKRGGVATGYGGGNLPTVNTFGVSQNALLPYLFLLP